MDKENQDSSGKPRTQSLGKRLRNLSGDILGKKSSKDHRYRSQSGDTHNMNHQNRQRVKHHSGDQIWDLTGDRIRNLSGEEKSSPRQQELNSGTKVMIALDDSSHSEETIYYYLRHVHRPDNNVILAHVIELPENAQEAMKTMLSRDTIEEMWQEGITKVQKIEKKYAEILKKQGIKYVHVRNESGLKPGQALCAIADEEQVNMILVGSRGEGKLRRTLMGSVSDYIVHHASCPVLVCQYSTFKSDRHIPHNPEAALVQKQQPSAEQQQQNAPQEQQ